MPGIREALLAATAPTEVVQLPEIGQSVTVRGMTGVERDAFEWSCFEQKRNGKREFRPANMRAKLVAFCCINGDGTRTFTDADAEALGNTRGDVIDRIFNVASRLSGLSKEDSDELGLGSANTTATSSASSASRTN